MDVSFPGKSYSKILHETAKATAPGAEKYESMLQSIMTAAADRNVISAATAAVGVSYAAAAAKTASMARQAVLRVLGGVTAVGVSAAVMASAIIPPVINDVYVDNAAPLVSSAYIVIETDSLIPAVNVRIIPDNGAPFPALPDSEAKGMYRAPVYENGTYTVEVIGFNHHVTTRSLNVSCIDSDIPVMERYFVEGDRILIYFSDESGVNWADIYALDADGRKILPTAVNEETGCVTFALPESDIDLYIQDNAGNQAKSAIRVD